MDDRLNRFKFCDSWLYPYINVVFARLPENIRDEILDDTGFQILSSAALSDECGHLFNFDQPLEYLVYLNPALMLQPDHRLECSIAMELASYVAYKKQKNEDAHWIQALLISWGFQNEVDAVCFCSAVAGSRAYKAGYEWARGQSEDYLMLHFGIYYDEWNRKGLVQMSRDRLEKLRAQPSPRRLLPSAALEGKKQLPEGVTADEALIEGIMAAVKEIKLRVNTDAL